MINLKDIISIIKTEDFVEIHRESSADDFSVTIVFRNTFYQKDITLKCYIKDDNSFDCFIKVNMEGLKTLNLKSFENIKMFKLFLSCIK